MDEIYLSPRIILSYLKDLEEKVPVPSIIEFKADETNKFNCDADLEREAKRILEFAGLDRCVPTCKFKEIEGNISGYTVNNPSIFEIPIWVNEKHKGNQKCCRAILAHEICHKVIFLNGINFTFPAPPEYNEIFTDLCTMYIGLGRIVLDGYINADTNQLNMGYLKPDMYRQTYHIVAKVNKKYKLSEKQDDLNDPFLQEALDAWTSPEECVRILRDDFLKKEERLSTLNRNILLLHQLLDQMYNKNGEVFRKYSKEAENLGIYGEFKYKKPLKLFGIVYERILADNEKDVVPAAPNESLESRINDLILTITDEYEDIRLGSLDYSTVKCPNCSHSSTTKIEDRDTVIKCKSCGIYFRFSNSHLNITKMRRSRDAINSAKEKEIKQLKDETERIAREKHRLLQKEAELDKNLKNRYEAGKSEVAATYKNIISGLPKWLKILAGKKLPETI